MTPSPCKHICQLDRKDICVGCGRTRAEIGGWMAMNDAEKAMTCARATARLRGLAGAEDAHNATVRRAAR